jgi:hypothetical protein
MTSKTRLLANLITNTGDVKSTNLDNVVASGGVDSAGTLSLVGIDGIVREHSHTISANYTLDSAKNGLVAGPIFIDSGITITINDSATLVIA